MDRSYLTRAKPDRYRLKGSSESHARKLSPLTFLLLAPGKPENLLQL